ncbi:acyl-CoA dehydrogenase family protein [Kitasatospora sp. NPDC059088]|uniref:acyl-CoA dehydrogenase family protein n=1 Tax=Kitasatospora sp. NPDC059088 TaxID=3346722 RepID=UPI0036C18463
MTILETETLSAAERKRKALVQAAEELGSGTLRELAAQWDRCGEFPQSSVQAVREAGLLALTVPEEDGGASADLLTVCQVIEELAAGCASTALILVMHWTSLLYMGSWCQEPDARAERERLDELRRKVFRSVVDDGTLVASCYGEPGSGASIFTPFTRAVQQGGTWVVDGCKLGTLAQAAGHLQFHAVVAEGEDAGKIVQFVVPRDLPGIVVEPGGSIAGVRAAAPARVSFEACMVPERFVFGPVGAFQQANDYAPYATVLLAAPYVGIARAALDEARRHLSTRTIQGMDRPISAFPTTRQRLGHLLVEYESARALLHSAAERALLRPTPEVRILNEAIKVKAAETAVQVTTECLQLCGARMLSQRLPLERMVRDSLAGAMHPPTTPEAVLTIAELFLGTDKD